MLANNTPEKMILTLWQQNSIHFWAFLFPLDFSKVALTLFFHHHPFSEIKKKAFTVKLALSLPVWGGFPLSFYKYFVWNWLLSYQSSFDGGNLQWKYFNIGAAKVLFFVSIHIFLHGLFSRLFFSLSVFFSSILWRRCVRYLSNHKINIWMCVCNWVMLKF